MRYDFETNVTVRTLTINNTGIACRYINQRGEFDFQSRDIKLVSMSTSSAACSLQPAATRMQTDVAPRRALSSGTRRTVRTTCPPTSTASPRSTAG